MSDIYVPPSPHDAQPWGAARWETSFSRCVTCGQTITRIDSKGKVGAWRHMRPEELPR